MKIFIAKSLFLLLIPGSVIVAQDKTGTITGNKLDKAVFNIRDNSRNVAPIRRTNLRNRMDANKKVLLMNQKRNHINKQRATLFRQQMLQNKKRMNAQKRLIQKRIMQRKARQQKMQMRRRMRGN